MELFDCLPCFENSEHLTLRRVSLGHRLLRAASWILWPFSPRLRRLSRTLKASSKIERLEVAGQFEAARAIRRKLLDSIAQPEVAILWRSEGEDALFRRREPEAALAAFQAAMVGLHPPPYPAVYVSIGWYIVYFGAAASALILDRLAEARRFTDELSRRLDWEIACFGHKERAHEVWHYWPQVRAAVTWLRSHLGEA